MPACQPSMLDQQCVLGVLADTLDIDLDDGTDPDWDDYWDDDAPWEIVEVVPWWDVADDDEAWVDHWDDAHWLWS